MKAVRLAFTVAVVFVLVGCVASNHETPEDIEVARMALVGNNALPPNGLNPNGLNPNGLNPNGLSVTALDPQALDSSVLAAIQDETSIGALSRKLLRYSVECALEVTQSFSFTWTDGTGTHPETYWGLLGIAPAWATSPLDETGQEMVSACLAARTNWYGATVTISMRAPLAPLNVVPAGELDAYPRIEGAFWGNLFAPVPHLAACYKGSNGINSRMYLRDCAIGHLNADFTISECGMIHIVGHCWTHCVPLDSTSQYYPSCSDSTWGTTTHIATAALP